jgi:hypothetical protein
MISLTISLILVAAQSAPQLFESTDVVADANIGALSDAIEYRTVAVETS